MLGSARSTNPRHANTAPIMAQSEIDALVSDFTQRLSTLVRRSALEQVLVALGGDMPATKRGAGRPKGMNTGQPKVKKGAGASGRNSSAMSETVLAHIQANPGQRADAIAKALGTNVDKLRPVTKALIAEKKLKTHGQRRGMTYQAV